MRMARALEAKSASLRPRGIKLRVTAYEHGGSFQSGRFSPVSAYELAHIPPEGTQKRAKTDPLEIHCCDRTQKCAKQALRALRSPAGPFAVEALFAQELARAFHTQQ